MTPLPIFGARSPLPPRFDLIVLVVLLGLLAGILVAKRPRRLIIGWATLFFLRAFWDRATWQPFFLMYGFLLLAIAFAPWDERTRRGNGERGRAV